MTSRQGIKSGNQSKSVSTRSRKSVSFDANTKSSATTDTSKTVSTTVSNFRELVRENGVLDEPESTPPANLAWLHERLDRSRKSPPPTSTAFEKYVDKVQNADNEQTMLVETTRLLNDYDSDYQRTYNQALGNFPKNVGFNTKLSPPQPDMIEGLRLKEFKPFPVAKKLGTAVIPRYLKPRCHSITLPHSAGEWKGRGKDMSLAQVQASYDGACMVYGRDKARSFIKSPDPDGYAYVQTFITDGNLLNTYAHYSSASQDQDDVEYHQCETSSTYLTSSYEDFKKGRRLLRNLQDMAKETSEKLKDELKEKWAKPDQLPVEENFHVTSGASSDTLLLREESEDELGQSDPPAHRTIVRFRNPNTAVARRGRRKRKW